MIIYFMSSPDDNILLLTADRDVALSARKIAKENDEPFEIQSWDTDASPLCTINLKIEMGEAGEASPSA